ncbi:hypothetical protein LCGC14_1399850 [marine sediment metagenome]|uniref:Uncharacterized protein n=1 Tax=marine sediment metagenome TaxID=412755 RepID=A0A0F9JXF5_9ZZZZ
MHPLAVGMYIRSICFQWAHGSVPNDPRKIQQITGVTPQEFNEHWSEVTEKLVLNKDGHWINQRAQVEMEKKLGIVEKRVIAGQKGGLAKAKAAALAKGVAKGVAKTWQMEEGRRKKEEGRGKGEDGSRKTEEDRPANIRAVFEHYRTYHLKLNPDPSSTSKEWQLIRERLKDGYTVDDLKAAIDGCHRSSYHCGENPRGMKYQSLELIVRDAKHVQEFLEVPEKQAVLSEKERRGQRAGENFLKGKP